MCEETGNKAVELTDEEIEKAAGGKKHHHTHTCSFYQQITPGTVGAEYCSGFCQYGQADATGVRQCSGGQTMVSNDDIWSAFYYWTNHGMN